MPNVEIILGAGRSPEQLRDLIHEVHGASSAPSAPDPNTSASSYARSRGRCGRPAT